MLPGKTLPLPRTGQETASPWRRMARASHGRESESEHNERVGGRGQARKETQDRPLQEGDRPQWPGDVQGEWAGPNY